MERLKKKTELRDELALDLLKLKIQLQRLKTGFETRFEPMLDDVREQQIKEAEDAIVELELKRMQKS